MTESGVAGEPEGLRVGRLASVGLTTRNAGALAEFYAKAFGSRTESCRRRAGPAFERLMEVRGGAMCQMIALGDTLIEMMEFDTPGRPYPADLSPSDTRFQHFAMVVTDMSRAVQRLAGMAGWNAISTSGPQRLPERSGGVTAFKFRDPDGHPLELLAFPYGKNPEHWQRRTDRGVVLGVDHSAISVENIGRSVDFYSRLGLEVRGHSVNSGIEQEHLDGVPHPCVDVVALAPVHATPHVELLRYQTASRPVHDPLAANDIAATRMRFLARGWSAETADLDYTVIRDPDGHILEISTCHT